MFSSADSTALFNAIFDIKNLISPNYFKYALDVCCIVSVVLSFFAILKVQMINSSLKQQKKYKNFEKSCNDYLNKLDQNYTPSDLNEKIKNTLETFRNELPFYFFFKRHRLKKSLKQIQSSKCDRILLLKNLKTDFQKDILQ